MQILKNILDYIWPCFCLSCQKEGHLFCPNCQKALHLLPLDYQAWDQKNSFVFDHCYVCLDYHQKIVQKLIKTFKYQYIKNLSNIFVDVLEQQAKLLNLSADTIICNIPLHAKKKKQRGFDQTEVLAEALSKKLNLTYLSLLVRSKNNRPQAHLERRARIENVQHIFQFNQKIQNLTVKKTVLLIDDVATTGSTLNEAAKTLKKLGFTKIIALVIAKN